MNTFTIEFLDEAERFIDGLSDKDKAKILAIITMMQTDYDAVYTKLVQRPVRELIVKKYRLLFCVQSNTIYFLSGFIKKTQKTPKREIEKAQLLSMLIQ